MERGVGRCVADELGGVERTHSVAAVPAGEGGDMPYGLGSHGLHGRVDVLGDELIGHVLVEDGPEIRRRARHSRRRTLGRATDPARGR